MKTCGKKMSSALPERQYVSEDYVVRLRGSLTINGCHAVNLNRLHQKRKNNIPREEQLVLRAGILGVPNAGKSTLVNRLAGNKVQNLEFCLKYEHPTQPALASMPDTTSSS